jgi:hypothetical protein
VMLGSTTVRRKASARSSRFLSEKSSAGSRTGPDARRGPPPAGGAGEDGDEKKGKKIKNGGSHIWWGNGGPPRIEGGSENLKEYGKWRSIQRPCWSWFLPKTSKFWSRGPYRGPHWSCSQNLRRFEKEKMYSFARHPPYHTSLQTPASHRLHLCLCPRSDELSSLSSLRGLRATLVDGVNLIPYITKSNSSRWSKFDPLYKVNKVE